MKERVQFQCRDVRRPRQSRGAVNHDVVDVRPSRTSRNGKGTNPIGGKTWYVLIPVRAAAHAIRESFECYRTIRQVRKQVRRNPDVVIDDVGFGELSVRVKNLFRTRDLDLPPVNFQDVAVSRLPRQTTLLMG